MSKNDITGDEIMSGASSESYRSGWDRIWGDKVDSDLTDHGRPIKCNHQGNRGGLHQRAVSADETGCCECCDEQSTQS